MQARAAKARQYSDEYPTLQQASATWNEPKRVRLTAKQQPTLIPRPPTELYDPWDPAQAAAAWSSTDLPTGPGCEEYEAFDILRSQGPPMPTPTPTPAPPTQHYEDPWAVSEDNWATPDPGQGNLTGKGGGALIVNDADRGGLHSGGG